MKNNILKVFVLFVFFCVITPAFAVLPGGPGSGGTYDYDDPNGFAVEAESSGEADEANLDPIDNNILLLAGVGILVAGFFFNRNRLVKA